MSTVLTVLQTAIKKRLDIYLFYSSGTGLVCDQATGTVHQMQRIIEPGNDHHLGGTDGTPIKMITFLQLAIPYTPLPVEALTVTEMCYKLDIDKFALTHP